jgi:hypothetical protein
MRNFQNIEEWLAYDLVVRHCANHEKDVRDKLGLVAVQSGWSYGVNIGERVIDDFAKMYGEKQENAHLELARRLKIELSYRERFLLAEKSGSTQVPSFDPPYSQTVYGGYPVSSDFPLYTYYASDGKKVLGYVAKFQSQEKSVKLPVTMWQGQNGSTQLETLAFCGKWPLYNLNRLSAASNKQAVICTCEEQADSLTKIFHFLQNDFIFTTWVAGSKWVLETTDWERLQGFKCVLVVEDSAEGFRLADSLYLKLKEIVGGGNIYFALPHKRRSNYSNEYAWLTSLVGELSDVFTGVSSNYREDFLSMALAYYGLELEEKFEPVDADEFIARQQKKSPVWVIPELIRKGDRVMVYAAPKAGKTTFLLNASFLMSEAGLKVLYIDGEMSEFVFAEQLQRTKKGRKTPNWKILSACAMGDEFDFELRDNQKKYAPFIREADVIIFDNLNALFPSSLNSTPESCKELNRYVFELSRQEKTVVIVHHSTSSGNPFGSNVKLYGLDLMLEVTPDKSKSLAKIAPQNCRWVSEEFRKAFEIPYSDEAGLSEDWFTPEKRYLSPTKDSQAKNRKSAEIPCSDEVEKVEKEQIPDGQIDSLEPKNIKLEASIKNAAEEKNDQPESVAPNSRKPSKASQQRAEDKERARSELQKNPDIKVRELASLLGCSSGKAGDILKEIKAEDQNS